MNRIKSCSINLQFLLQNCRLEHYFNGKIINTAESCESFGHHCDNFFVNNSIQSNVFLEQIHFKMINELRLRWSIVIMTMTLMMWRLFSISMTSIVLSACTIYSIQFFSLFLFGSFLLSRQTVSFLELHHPKKHQNDDLLKL